MDPVCRADGSGAQCFAAVALVELVVLGMLVVFALLGIHAIEQINVASALLTQ